MSQTVRLLVAVGFSLVVGAAVGARFLVDNPTARRFFWGASAPATTSPTTAALGGLAARPADAQEWAHLADTLRSSGELAGAEAGFRAALSLDPKDPQLHAQLGYTLLERGRELEAWAQLEEAKASGDKTAMLDFTLKSLGARIETSGAFPRFVAPAPSTPPPSPAIVKGDTADEDATNHDDAPREAPPQVDDEPEGFDPEPKEPEATEPEPKEPESVPPPVAPPPPVRPLGPCEIAARPMNGRGTYLVDVSIDGVQTALILDTGATLTVISSEFADQARIRAEAGHSIGAQTAGGFVRFETAVTSSISVGERSVENVRVAICEDCTNELAAGLLGLDVQRPLGLALDVRNHVVRFADCE